MHAVHGCTTQTLVHNALPIVAPHLFRGPAYCLQLSRHFGH